jgi:hypothetical protein
MAVGDYSNTETCANSAISNAYDLKHTYKAKVFTIGILDDSDPSDVTGLTNRMLNYISSNYPNATSMSAGETGSNAGYYKAASNASQLDTVFQTIAGSLTPSITLGSTTVVKDVVTDTFKIATDDTHAITVQKVPCTGKYGGSYTWGTAAATGITPTTDGKTISVTGFDFTANCVTDTVKPGTTDYGSKLVITIPIALKLMARRCRPAVSGDQVYTNGPGFRRIYTEYQQLRADIEPFERPQTTLYTCNLQGCRRSGCSS